MENIPRGFGEDTLNKFWGTPKWNKYSKPEGFEEYLYIKGDVDAEIMKLILETAHSIGDKSLYYFPSEYKEGEDLSQIEKRISVNECDQLIEQIRQRNAWGLEFYLVGENFDWMVWAYHESCIHIAGTSKFITALKKAYPTCKPCQEYIEWERTQ